MKHTEGDIRIGEVYDEKEEYGCWTAEVWHKVSFILSYVHGMTRQEAVTNAERICDLWNAANGMTTKQAVAYLEHGGEMVEVLEMASVLLHAIQQETGTTYATRDLINSTLAKLEVK